MNYRRIDSTYVIRLEPGEKLLGSLLELCAKENIRGGHFQGLGAASRVELGHFDVSTKKYSTTRLEGQYEITALFGSVSVLGEKPYIHAHVNVGDDAFQSRSGHLVEAVISATCEIFMTVLSGRIDRMKDGITGLNLLDL